MRFGDEGRDAQALQLITLRRADTAGPQQQQVRFEAQQLLHIELTIAADRRNAGNRRWPLTGIKHTDQQICRIQLNDNFRKGRREADHTQLRQR
ncbi:hypothetical protein D3C78_1467040 [compost metagenome]